MRLFFCLFGASLFHLEICITSGTSIPLSTYAMWWIRAQIQEYVLHSWSLVKIGTTAAQKKLFFNLRKIKNQLTSIDSGNLSPENVREIATRLDVKEGEVIDMENRLFTSDQSLNVKLGDEHDTEQA